MVGKITVTGSGGITTDDDGTLSTWSVTEAVTPVAIGQPTAATGGLSFSGTRDETDGNYSEWAVANAATFTHEDDGSGALGDLEGNISGVTTTGGTVSGSMATILQQLSAERTMPTQGTYTHYAGLPNLTRANGTPYQGEFVGPLGMVFDSSGNFFLAERGGRVIKFDPTGAYLAATAGDAVGAGFGSGNGQFSATNGAYALAIDSSDRILATDPGNNRVQRFTNALAYDTQFGTLGSGNGQFNTPYGIAVDSTDRVYVVDGLNYRVQRFTSGLAYSTKWGTQGSGSGQFLLPRGVTIASGGDVLVLDLMNLTDARVQRFTDSGTIQPGGFNVDRTNPEENLLPSSIIVDSNDYIYITEIQANIIQRYTPGGVLDGTWGSYGTGAGEMRDPAWIAFTLTGNIYVSDYGNNRVLEFTPASGDYVQPLSTYFQQYVDLCLAGHVIDYAASSDPDVLYQGWTDNVWTKLNELCAATGTELGVVGGVITIRDIGSTDLDPELFTSGSIAVDTINLARAVDIVYQNVDYGDGVVMYDARLDDNRIFTIAAGKTETITISTNSYPVVVNNPVVTDSILIGPGQYHVTGADDLPVVSSEWLDYGGSVTAEIGDNPNQIDITLTGPTEEIPGVPGPYSFAASDGASNYATLSITGSGVTTDPRTLHLYTGADPALVTQETQTTITNIHIVDEHSAYDRGVWASDLACGPNVTLTGTLALESVSGFGLTSGSMLAYADSRYRILSSTVANSAINLTATRHVTAGDEYDVWSGLAEITNLSENPSFETNLTGFTASSSTTITQSATWAASGTNSMRIDTTSNSGRALVGNASGAAFGGSIPWNLEPSRTYTLTADVHSVQPGGGSWLTDAGVIEITYGTAAANNIALTESSPLDFPTTDATVSLTFTVPANAEGLQIAFYATGIGASWYAYWDAIIVTEGATPWEFFDGSFSGASWVGTTNLSASTRSPTTAGDYAAYWNGEPAKNAIIRPLRHP